MSDQKHSHSPAHPPSVHDSTPPPTQSLGQWYVKKYISDVSEQNYFLELLDTHPIANLDKHMADIHNQNDIITEIKTFEKKSKTLKVFANTARHNKAILKLENECDRAAISGVLAIIQQEKDFQKAVNLYKDFCSAEFKASSEIFLEDDNRQPIPSNITELEDSVEGLDYMIISRAKEIQWIDELIRLMDERSKLCEHNSKEIERFAKETKRLFESYGQDFTLEEKLKEAKEGAPGLNKSGSLSKSPKSPKK